MAGLWSAFPPEVNAGQLMAGDQGASIAAAAAAYEALAAALIAEGAKMAATAGTTAATGWQGVGGVAMVATAMPYVAALEALSGWVQQSAASAAAIEQAYVTAKAAMIQVPICDHQPHHPGRARRDEHHRPEHPGDHRARHRILRPLLDAERGEHGRLRSHRDAPHRRARHPAPARAADREPCGSGRPGRGDRAGRRQRCGERRDVAELVRRPTGLGRRSIGRRRAGELRAVDGLDGPADAEPARPAAADARTISSDARTVPTDAWASSHRWRWACLGRLPVAWAAPTA